MAKKKKGGKRHRSDKKWRRRKIKKHKLKKLRRRLRHKNK